MTSRLLTIIAIVIMALLIIYGYLARPLIDLWIGNPVNWGRIGIEPEVITIFVAVFTAACVCVQTITLNRHVFGDIAVRLHDEFFFKEKNKEIIRAIERGTLGLKPGKYLTEETAPSNCEPQKIFWCEEEDLDDYLGVIELLHTFWKRKVLDLEYIDELFGHYICSSRENSVVNRYVELLKEKEDYQDYYSGFEELAKKLS